MERNGTEQLKNGQNGKKDGTGRNGMERTIKRNGTDTPTVRDKKKTINCTYVYTCTCIYSRGPKKVNFSFPRNEEFHFVSVLSRWNFKIDRLRSHFPFCVFRFSVFPCPTKNATGERADRWEPRERSIVKATRSPRLRFLARKAFRVL